MKLSYVSSALCVGITILATALPPEARAATESYENTAILSASDLLKAEYIRGPYHEILDPVPTAGFANQYTLRTTWGNHTVRGNDLLAQRLGEFEAIAKLEQASKSEEFEKALRAAAAKPFYMAGQTLQDPVGTAKKVGSGAMRFIRRAGEFTKRGGERSAHTDNAAQAVIGFSKQKREIAYELKVDPYTDNPTLQQHLDDMAWASFGGGFVVRVGTFAVGGAAGGVVSGLSTADDIAKSIRDNSPNDLSGANRTLLEEMGIDPATIDAFLQHEAISPTNQTIITRKLHDIRPAAGCTEFLKMLNSSQNTTEVLFFQRIILMVVNYHSEISPVKQILNLNGLPALHLSNNSLVVPLSVDYGWWSEEADRLSEAIANYEPEFEVTKRIIYVSGTLSPLAKEQLTKRGLVVVDNAHTPLYR
jgi:hypothetical protein